MSDAPVRVKLWDPLLRGFHWLLAFLVTANWILAQVGPKKMTLHFWFGYAIAALLVFRLIWGFIGPPEARFTHFIKGPRAVMSYAGGLLRRSPSYWPGHNPMGALSVVALLVLLAVQVVSGLFSDPNDFLNVGPLAKHASPAGRKLAVSWHETGGALILLLVVLHVGIVLFYRYWKREDLVRPMIDGWKHVIRRD